MSKRFYPRYDLVLASNHAFILSSQKINIIGSAHYVIGMNSLNLTKKSKGYLGKVRTDTSGTEYNVFGPGESPNKKLSPDKTRDQFAAIYYVH